VPKRPGTKDGNKDNNNTSKKGELGGKTDEENDSVKLNKKD